MTGNVILCPLKADPTADDFNKRLIAALKELPTRPAPYIVHCKRCIAQTLTSGRAPSSSCPFFR